MTCVVASLKWNMNVLTAAHTCERDFYSSYRLNKHLLLYCCSVSHWVIAVSKKRKKWNQEKVNAKIATKNCGNCVKNQINCSLGSLVSAFWNPEPTWTEQQRTVASQNESVGITEGARAGHAAQLPWFLMEFLTNRGNGRRCQSRSSQRRDERTSKTRTHLARFLKM